MKKNSGFTLVEIMIAMGVSMVALAAAFLMFRDSTKANNRQSLALFVHKQLLCQLPKHRAPADKPPIPWKWNMITR